MDFKKGYTIKPKEVLTNGEVIFTDGTNDVRSNQITCEAYGYNWGGKSQKCFAYRHNSKVHTSFSNTTNQLQGAENNIEKGSGTTIINGNKNTVKSNSRNNLINGESNEVGTDIQNAVVFGKFGKVLRKAEVVIGGGLGLGLAQSSIVQLSGTSTNTTPTHLTIQGFTDEFIPLQNNSILSFEAKVIGMVSGGSSGTVGHYIYQEIIGVVRTDNAYDREFSQSTTTIASDGTTGSAVMANPTSQNISVQVTAGGENINIEWFASVQLTEKKLTSATFTH